MQHLSARIWASSPGLLDFETSFGTLAWTRGGDGRARVWESDGTVVAWARLVPGYRRIRRADEWDDAPPSLVWQVALDVADRTSVLAAVMSWAESRSDEPLVTSHAEADAEAATMLAESGYVAAPGEPFGVYLGRRVTPDDVGAPDGYSFVTMAQLDDLEARAAVHREAWSGSTFSADDLRSAMSTWPYRPELDVIAVAPGGDLAASAIVWFDESLGYGEFEPVGTVPEHRGKGVAAALLRFGLGRLSEAGGEHAVVGARGDEDYPLPRRLYESVGFEVSSRQVVVGRV